MIITKKDVGIIMQEIYDSEIGIRIGWKAGGGMDYSISETSNDIWDNHDNTAEIIHTGETDIVKGLQILVLDILKQYPQSNFAVWLKEFYENDNGNVHPLFKKIVSPFKK